MSGGARTPEELEMLLEDALVVRDRAALAALFENSAVLGATDRDVAHGAGEIADRALATWRDDRVYVAAPWSIVQARELALIGAQDAIHVARRGNDGAWRFVLSLAP